MRPTGLVDPEVEVRPALTQVDDVLSEVNERAAQGERVLVTTLTKRMAEELTEYLREHNVRVRYLHSDIDTVERVEIIRDLRAGVLTYLWASICCAKDWTSRKCRLWPFLTQIKKVSCDQPDH